MKASGENLRIEQFLQGRLRKFKPFLVLTDLSMDYSTLNSINLSRGCANIPSPQAKIIRPDANKTKIEKAIQQIEPEIQPNPSTEQCTPLPEIEKDDLPEEDFGIVAGNLVIKREKLFDPVPEGACASMNIIIKDKKANTWEIVDCSTQKTILTAERDSRMGSYTIDIHPSTDPSDTLCSVKCNFMHTEFYTVSKERGEIAAMNFKVKKKSKMPIKFFSALIPRLGEMHRACDGSVLLKEPSKAIQLFPKPPKMKGGIPVLYFGGRVKLQSSKNHILVGDGADANIMVFGKAREDMFVCDVRAPLSPIQGISLALPHFK